MPFGVTDGPCSIVLLGEGEEDGSSGRFVGVVRVCAGVGGDTEPGARDAVGGWVHSFGSEAVDGDGCVGSSGHERKEVALAFFSVRRGGVALLEVGGFVDARANGGIGGGDIYGGVPSVMSDDVCGTHGVGVGAVNVARVGQKVRKPLDGCRMEAGTVGRLGSVCAHGRRRGGRWPIAGGGYFG